MKLYKEIMVWKHLNESTALRYSCLQDLTNKLFAVQSADFFRLPVDDKSIQLFNKQFIELFLEKNIHNDCTNWFSTLGEAIEAHEAAFSNLLDPHYS